jgi:hypothetical protein
MGVRRREPMMFVYATLIIPYLAALGRRALAAPFRAVRRTVR